ncbi:hypothetical protein E2C01_020541 [Portunus trituberculatus]|uniref:Uncharacterized protein n=1 Tax=Portunus trituberculatus TaxID=210409 RepID=A0A5B7E054_PORTR|nr:hypothetical protein [Portunus trituberculatus]
MAIDDNDNGNGNSNYVMTGRKATLHARVSPPPPPPLVHYQERLPIPGLSRPGTIHHHQTSLSGITFPLRGLDIALRDLEVATGSIITAICRHHVRTD